MKSSNQSFKSLKKGSLLMAEPFMVDPNFKRTAILICDHRPDGTVGFVINRPLSMNIAQLVAEFPTFESEVYFGGPVATDTIHYIHNMGDVLDGSIQVGRGMYWGGDFDKLKALIKSDLIQPDNIRFYIGYTGWDNGQLVEEFKGGSWFVSTMDPNYMFKSQPQQLWQQITNDLGHNYSVIAQMPDPVCLN